MKKLNLNLVNWSQTRFYGAAIFLLFFINHYAYTQGAGADNCSGVVTPITIGSNCSNSVSFTNNEAGAEAGVPPPPCISGTAQADVWYTVVGNGNTLDIRVYAPSKNMCLAVYTTCLPAGGSAIACSNVAASTAEASLTFPSTAGVTYYIQIIRTQGASANLTGTLCVNNYVAVTNDDCANATTLIPGASCVPVSGTITNALNSSNVSDCLFTHYNDVWYKFVATSANVSVFLTNTNNVDFTFAVYSGSCASAQTAVLCSDPNSGFVSSLTIGNTYYIRVSTYASTATAAGTFDICVIADAASGPCGNPQNNDFCDSPIGLVQGSGTFSGSTTIPYTADTPANLTSIFCGSIENDSWYSFVASASTATFNFTSVNGSQCTLGIQAQVYNVTENASGCCTNFTSMSNCYNPGTTALGTVNASGLTVGQTYILMIDGQAGDVCDYTISNWAATPLGVFFSDFQVNKTELGNYIFWETKAELNNAYFEVERSLNGSEFISIYKVDGAGTKATPTEYDWLDVYQPRGTVYYRIKQVDFNGDVSYSNLKSVHNTGSEMVSLYPNPTADVLYIDLQEKGDVQITLIGLDGKQVANYWFTDFLGQTVKIPTAELKAGTYMVQVRFGIEQKTTTQKLIKL